METSKEIKKTAARGLGLDQFGGKLSGLLKTPKSQAFREIALDLIDEDPTQPRTAANPGFSDESLSELAETIKERGVKSPISVRVNPKNEGRYIINHGARRVRASRIAGKKSIPAFVDEDYTKVDQIIENLQRNDLTPREIADYIGRQVSSGVQKQEIAKSLGKSNTFVSFHATLNHLPDPIADAFNIGKISDVSAINELVRLYKGYPKQVEEFLNEQNDEILRFHVKELRQALENAEDTRYNNKPKEIEIVDDDQEGEITGAETEEKEKEITGRIKKPVIRIVYKGKDGELLITRIPDKDNHAWILLDGSKTPKSVKLDSNLILISLQEGKR